MKVALVRCPEAFTICPPMGMATMSAHLKEHGHSVKIFDLAVRKVDPKIEKKAKTCNNLTYTLRYRYHWNIKALDNYSNKLAKEILEGKPDCICFSIYKTNLVQTLSLAREIKKLSPTSRIICGGPLCFYDFAYNFLKGTELFNAISRTQAELNVLKLIHEDHTEDVYQKNLNQEPLPDFTGFDLSKYPDKKISYSTTRGCYMKCTFCMDPSLASGYRAKSPDKIISDLKYLMNKYGVTRFQFADSTAIGSAIQMRRFCEKLIEADLKIRWGAQMRVEDFDDELVDLVAKSGCSWMAPGVESGSQRVVDHMGKQYDLPKIEKTLARAREKGIFVSTNILIGYPTETWSDFFKSISFCWRNRKSLNLINSHITAVFEGTALYDEDEKFGLKNKSKFYWSSKNSDIITRLVRYSIFRTFQSIMIPDSKHINREKHQFS